MLELAAFRCSGGDLVRRGVLVGRGALGGAGRGGAGLAGERGGAGWLAGCCWLLAAGESMRIARAGRRGGGMDRTNQPTTDHQPPWGLGLRAFYNYTPSTDRPFRARARK